MSLNSVVTFNQTISYWLITFRLLYITYSLFIILVVVRVIVVRVVVVVRII